MKYLSHSDRNYKQYRLGDYLIFANGDSTGWATWFKCGRGLDLLLGDVFKDDFLDILWLTSWKTRDSESRFRSIREVENFLGNLPMWTKTRWAAKWDDFGNGLLIDCYLGKVANPNAPEAALALKRIQSSFENGRKSDGWRAIQ